MISMMYTTRLFFTSRKGLVYSYEMETSANDIKTVVAKVREHVYMFKKTAKVNVGIYDENDTLKACWTSEDKIWYYLNDDDE